MLVLVTGSRDYPDPAKVWARLLDLPAGWTLIHGGARGPDSFAHDFALAHDVPTEVYEADWDGLGRGAGFRRNLVMLDQQPDLVLAFWDGESRGTAHTVAEAGRRGIPTEVIAP